jgi:hypothetical protein
MAQEPYHVVGRYRIAGPDGQKRVYHWNDVHRTGPSITLKAFHQGQRPAPLMTIQAPTVSVLPAPRRPEPLALTPKQFHGLMMMHITAGVPPQPDLGAEVLRRQQARGQR